MGMITGIKRLLGSTGLVLLVGWVLGTGTANAGEYTVYNCRTPDDAWAHNTDWTFTKGPFKSIDKFSSDCPNGPFKMEMLSSKTHPASDFMHAWFVAPPDTRITAYSFWRSVQLAYPYNYAIYEGVNGQYTEHDQCFAQAGCRSKGSWSKHVSTSNLVQASNRSADKLLLSITCGSSSSSRCPAKSPGAHLQIHRLDVTLEDNQDPILESAPSGPVVDPAKPPLTGLEPVSLSATDGGGGVYQALFEVDGHIVDRRVIDRNGGHCQQPFDLPRPCKNGASGTVMFNTATVPDGQHSLRILVTDAGGNTAAYGPVSIRTANASCNPDPRTVGLTMSAKFKQHGKKKGRRSITVPFGRSARVNGRLLNASGPPAANTDVCVSELPRMEGGQLSPAAFLKTDGRGQFSYRPTRGPSRSLFFVHRVSGGAVTSSLNMNVRAPVKLREPGHTLHNGQTLVMQGRLGEDTYATPGLLVELQAQRGRRHFQTFGTTHTNGAGEFRFSYRFTRTLGVQQYHLRAQIPAQRTYPFATGWSHPIAVKVIGPRS
jgi:hypothetical protein